MYPSNESWGVLGFTCLTREAAYARIDKMKEWDDAAPLPEQGKRGRGRPKGSKNKS